MTCKDCLHYEACNKFIWKEMMLLESVADFVCGDYKDKSRFVELPLKVGDVVFSITWSHEVQPFQITNITITQNKKGVWTNKYRAMQLRNGKTTYDEIDFAFDEIGKEAFLTREEAEKALAERGEK